MWCHKTSLLCLKFTADYNLPLNSSSMENLASISIHCLNIFYFKQKNEATSKLIFLLKFSLLYLMCKIFWNGIINRMKYLSSIFHILSIQEFQKIAFIAKYQYYIYVYKTFTISKGSTYLIMIKRIFINKRKHIRSISWKQNTSKYTLSKFCKKANERDMYMKKE